MGLRRVQAVSVHGHPFHPHAALRYITHAGTLPVERCLSLEERLLCNPLHVLLAVRVKRGTRNALSVLPAVMPWEGGREPKHDELVYEWRATKMARFFKRIPSLTSAADVG